MENKELPECELTTNPDEMCTTHICETLGETSESDAISPECTDSDTNNFTAANECTQTQDAEPEEKDSLDITFANCTVSELYELAREYPGEDVAKDILSEPFRIFSKQKTGNAKDIYSEYLELKRSFLQSRQTEKTPARGLSGQENKRAYSGFAQAGIHRDVSNGLTGRQMQIARESGMSFREYADILASLPHGRNL